MPKKSLPKKGTAEYNEQIADDPSDFIDESEEEEAGQDITPKAAAKTTTKTKNSAQKSAEKAAKMERNKVLSEKGAAGLLTPEEQKELIESFKTKEPTTKTKYDHETTMKNLIDDTEEAVALMEKLKNDYESVYYMGLLCEYWKTLMPLDRVQKNAHSAFNKYFKKHQHLHGLPPASGSKTSSRDTSRAPSVIDEGSQDEDEDEEEEEVEETK
jgi:hypothetical protein